MRKVIPSAQPLINEIRKDFRSGANPLRLLNSYFLIFYRNVVAFLTMALIWAESSSAVRPERICSDSS